MKIPNSIIYTVGDVLGSWYYNHTKLNTLFGESGFPGDPPPGNCIQKCQEWMRRANNDDDVNPLEMLGNIIREFMNLSYDENHQWRHGFQRITEILAKNGLSFELTGQIVSVTPENTAKPVLPKALIVQNEPVNSFYHQDTGTTPLSTITNDPIIIIMTVNDKETYALLDVFLGEGKAPSHITKGGVTYNELGIHGGHRIVHTICEMGAGGLGASQQRARQALEHWQPQAIVAVGIAFGLDETKQNIGEVLVSTQLQDYEIGRLNESGTLTPRGDKPSSSDILRNRLRQTDTTQQRLCHDWPKVQFGLVLSGQKLVDNLDYRESLKDLFTEAIGGEMEGIGLYVSASEAGVDWIVVKAICDWGHNKNQTEKDAWQRLAAKNAARVLKAALDIGNLYSSEQAINRRLRTKPTTVETGLLPSQTSGLSASFTGTKALEIWQKKLDFLLAEEAKTADADQKFSIQQRIEEAQKKIQELGG